MDETHDMVDVSTVRETLGGFSGSHGGTLADLADRQPILLVFVRHFG